jgi:hypothetical protein
MARSFTIPHTVFSLFRAGELGRNFAGRQAVNPSPYLAFFEEWLRLEGSHWKRRK